METLRGLGVGCAIITGVFACAGIILLVLSATGQL